MDLLNINNFLRGHFGQKSVSQVRIVDVSEEKIRQLPNSVQIEIAQVEQSLREKCGSDIRIVRKYLPNIGAYPHIVVCDIPPNDRDMLMLVIVPTENGLAVKKDVFEGNTELKTILIAIKTNGKDSIVRITLLKGTLPDGSKFNLTITSAKTKKQIIILLNNLKIAQEEVITDLIGGDDGRVFLYLEQVEKNKE